MQPHASSVRKVLPLCAKLTYKIAAVAAAAAAAAKISARRRHGKKKSRFFRKLGKRKSCKTYRKNRWKFIKTLILEELCKNGRHLQILREKLHNIDLFSSLYDQKSVKSAVAVHRNHGHRNREPPLIAPRHSFCRSAEPFGRLKRSNC